MKDIQGATFTMGNNNLIGSPDQKVAAPEHQVTLSSYSMSEAEITNAQYVAFLNAAFSDGLIQLSVGVAGPDKDKSIIIGGPSSDYSGEVLYTLDGIRVLKDHGNEDGDNNEFTGSVEPENPLNISYIGFNSATQTFYVKDPFNPDDFNWKDICDYQDYGTTARIFEGAILNDFDDWAGAGLNYSNELEGWTENNPAGAINLPTQAEVSNWPVTFIRWWGAKAFADYYNVKLPTEAQWEYAAKGGLNFEYAVHDGQSVNDANWNNEGTNNLATGHVRSAISGNSNPFGLYNLAGNAWEWIADNYIAPYDTATVTDPFIEENGSTLRSWRGGAWNYHEATLQSSIRFYDEENRGNDHFGFRITGTHSGTDITIPELNNLALTNSPLGNTTIITYTATFNEAVSLVSTDDFTLTKTGTANGTISNISTNDNIIGL
jgi:formylglycine-generating enzyme required for sulfatase activity